MSGVDVLNTDVCILRWQKSRIRTKVRSPMN